MRGSSVFLDSEVWVVIPFTSAMVGLIVRGKRSPTDKPSVMNQHADCILPDGSPIGFFGEGPNRSGGRTSASSMRVGMNMQGIVYDYGGFQAARPWYVNMADAKAADVLSTVLTVNVSAPVAAKFAAFWKGMAAKPGGFDLLGNNCSTHASAAFVNAGILPGGIPGLDTPDNLYRQLVAKLPGNTASYSGHVAFSRRAAGGFDVVVE